MGDVLNRHNPAVTRHARIGTFVRMVRDQFGVLQIFSILVLFPLFCLPAYAQVAVSGFVRDAERRQPLAAVHVIVEGQERGTITNRGGQFEIVLPMLPATLLFRHIGYETVRLEIGPNDSRNLTVDMPETVYQMEQVIIAGDRFAEDLMRIVIERKQRRRSHLNQWYSRGYSRITLESRRGVVLVSENVFDAYRDAVQGDRNVIRSRRQTGSFYADLGIDPIPVDLSGDVVEIQGLQFVGPTHPDALRFYHFSFAGTRKYAGQDVYDLFIAPRDALHPTFIGSVAVLDSTYALIEANLRPARHVEYMPHVRAWDVTYQQQFAAADSFWLPMGLLVEGVIHVDPEDAGVGPAGFRQVALSQDHLVNQPGPGAPASYTQDARLEVDERSVFRDDLFLMGRDIVALLPEETKALETLRMTDLSLEDALPSLDLEAIPRVLAESIPDGDEPLFVWPLIWGVEPWLQFNRVDGYVAGGGYTADVGPGNIGARVAKAAGDNDTRFTLRWMDWWAQNIKGTVVTERTTAPQQGSRIYTTAMNSVMSRLGYGDYFDYMKKTRLRVRADFIYPKVRMGVGTQIARHRPIDQSFKRAWPFRGDFSINPPVERADWWVLDASITVGDHWRPFRTGPNRRLEARAERMMGSSGASFERYALWMDGFVETFQRRRPRPMGLSVRALGRSTRGIPPLEGLIALEGSMGLVSTLGVLRSLRSTRYLGRHAAGVYWEHDFRTALWELVGLRFLVVRRTGIVVGGAHARMWPGSGGFHHELTASLVEVFGSPFRVDLTRRLDVPGWFVSIGLSRKFKWGAAFSP